MKDKLTLYINLISCSSPKLKTETNKLIDWAIRAIPHIEKLIVNEVFYHVLWAELKSKKISVLWHWKNICVKNFHSFDFERIRVAEGNYGRHGSKWFIVKVKWRNAVHIRWFSGLELTEKVHSYRALQAHITDIFFYCFVSHISQNLLALPPSYLFSKITPTFLVNFFWCSLC